jgi:dephospho-CoA kinase
VRAVALTGGIASGKSFVADELARLGAAIVDADLVYHELLEGSELPSRIRAAFGDRFFRPDGSLDRRALGAHVFADPAELARLGRITHPAILAAITDRLADLSAGGRHDMAVVVAALLFEAGWAGTFDTVVVVALDEDEQLRRLMARSNLSRDEARARVASQLPLTDKVSRATHVVWNDGSRDETRARVEKLWTELRGSAPR